MYLTDFEVISPKANGTLCKASIFNDSEGIGISEYQLCNINGTILDRCYESQGSHSKTFWVYFSLRMMYQVS